MLLSLYGARAKYTIPEHFTFVNHFVNTSNVSLDNLDRRNIDEQAADLARCDLAANRIPASELGATIERYAQELSEKKKDSKASNALFNAMIRGEL